MRFQGFKHIPIVNPPMKIPTLFINKQPVLNLYAYNIQESAINKAKLTEMISSHNISRFEITKFYHGKKVIVPE